MKKCLTYYVTALLCLPLLSASAATVLPFAEFLYWHASEQPASTWASVSTFTLDEYKAENNNFGWSPGVRLGVSYEPDALFDTTLYWTYFSTQSKDTIPLGPHLVIPQFFSGFLSGNLFFGASSQWDMTMNMVDLQISHPFVIARNLVLSPAIGLKGGVINQTIDTRWEADIYTANENVTHDYGGVGPSFGVSGIWNMTQTFRFMGSFSAAFMWGNWDVKDVYTRPYVPLSLTPDATEITTELEEAALGAAMLSYFLGLEWSPEVFSRATFVLGYEMQYWPNQLRLTTFQELPTHGDLTLQGGTCGITIGF